MADLKPSFCKALFSGVILDDLVFPYPKMQTEEAENLKMIIDTFNKFADDNIDSAKFDREAKIPKEVIEGLKELGFFGLNTAEEYGGFGLSSTAFTKVLAAVSAHDGSLSLTLGAHQSIGIKALSLFGNEQQKKKYYPKLVSGEMVGAFCLSEPGAGSDAAGIKTKAVWDDKNDCYILNGSKLWITNGGFADFFTVFAKEEIEKDGEKTDKITAFIVTADLPGISRGKEEEKMGQKERTLLPPPSSFLVHARPAIDSK